MAKKKKPKHPNAIHCDYILSEKKMDEMNIKHANPII